MSVEKNIIAVTGRVRAGKETVARIIAQKHNALELSSSEGLYETLRLFSLPTIRKNTQTLSTFLRTTFHSAVLEYPLIKAIEASNRPIAIVTSVRRVSDFSELKRTFRFTLLFVDAPIERRYELFIQSLKDPNDARMTFEEFCISDVAESESEIEGLKEHADCVITNTGSIDDLESKVLDFLSSLSLQ